MLDFLERNSEERDIEVENGGLDNALAMLCYACRGDSMGRREAGRQAGMLGLPPQRQIYIRSDEVPAQVSRLEAAYKIYEAGRK